MIKNEDTVLFRVVFVEGISECCYVRVKKSDLDLFDPEVAIKELYFKGNNSSEERMLFFKFSSDIDNGYVEVHRCSDDETNFEQDEFTSNQDSEDNVFVCPNVFIEPSGDGESIRVTEKLLENPTFVL